MRLAYDEVYVYTMGRPGFILQHVVDAYGAHTSTSDSQPIGLVFALLGLPSRREALLTTSGSDGTHATRTATACVADRGSSQ